MYTNINMDDWIRMNFANIFTKYEVEFIIWTGDTIVHREKRVGSEEILKKTFKQLIKQIGNKTVPMKCRMEIPKVQHSINEDKDVEVLDYIEFKNKCMIQAEKESTS